jgi:hypothetical protein
MQGNTHLIDDQVLERFRERNTLSDFVQGRRTFHPNDEDLSFGTWALGSRQLDCISFDVQQSWNRYNGVGYRLQGWLIGLYHVWVGKHTCIDIELIPTGGSVWRTSPEAW